VTRLLLRLASGGRALTPQVDLPLATGQIVGYTRVSTHHQTHEGGDRNTFERGHQGL